MDRKTEWRRRLDGVLTNLSAQLKIDLYDNVVVPVVRDWFACWDSLSQLNRNIEQRLTEAWPSAQRKIEAAFREFETALKADLLQTRGIESSATLRLDEAGTQISATVANVVGAIFVVIAGTVAGGSGTALIASGPVGWVIGGIIGAIVLFLGKGVVHRVVETALRDRRLPPLLKRSAKSKVATELTLNGPRFEEKLFTALKERSGPLYEALDKLHD